MIDVILCLGAVIVTVASWGLLMIGIGTIIQRCRKTQKGRKAKMSFYNGKGIVRDAPQVNDNVHHPSHYCKGGIECIDVIRAAVSNLDGFEAFCTGCAIKYLWRWKSKNGIEDLQKAKTYIDMMIGERLK